MQPKQFNMLALTAVISLIAAGVVHSAFNSFNDETVTGERLFPSLESNGDATARINIQKGADKLTLEKSSDGKVWSIAERAGYPVNPDKVRALVVKLGQAELVERKTSNKDLHGALDLGDPTASGSSAKLVRLSDKAGAAIAELVVGRERGGAFGAGQAGTYVRTLSDPQTWLAKLELDATTSVMDWVEPVFFKIEKDAIDKIVVRQGETIVYQLGNAGPKNDEKKGPYKLLDVPAGKKQKADLRLDDLMNGIWTLEMVDVRARKTPPLKPDMTAEVTMDDGAKYLIGLVREDKKSWVTVNVLSDGKDSAATKAIAEATKGWAYEIADWRAEQTFKKPDDVWETVKSDVATPEASSPVAAPQMSVPSGLTAPNATGPRAETETTKKAEPAPEPANADGQK